MPFQTVKLTHKTDGTAVLRLNRPAVLNSINQQMIQELRTMLADVANASAGTLWRSGSSLREHGVEHLQEPDDSHAGGLGRVWCPRRR